MTAQADDPRQGESGIRTTGGGGATDGGDVGPALEWRVRPMDVHKRDPRNLWLSTAAIDEQRRFTVNFSIPAGDRPLRFVDLLEVERQAGIVFAHRSLGVPGDAAFVLSEISLELAPDLRWQGSASLAGKMQVSVVDPVESTQSVRKAAMEFDMKVHGRPSGWGFAKVRFLSPRLYARLRVRLPGPQPHVAVAPRFEPADPDVVLVDLLDPLVDDHSADHVPGMAVAAAIEKAVTADPGGWTLQTLSLSFQEYIEHHPPAVLSVDRVQGRELQGNIQQAGMTRATFSGLLSRREA